MSDHNNIHSLASKAKSNFTFAAFETELRVSELIEMEGDEEQNRMHNSIAASANLEIK